MLKLLYRLKQSGYKWYIKAAKGLAKLRLKPTFADTYVFVYKDYSLTVRLYINDIVIFTKDIIVICKFKRAIAQR